MVRHVDISSLLIRSEHCENESGDYIYPGRLYVSYHEIYTGIGVVLCGRGQNIDEKYDQCTLHFLRSLVTYWVLNQVG